MSVTRREHDLLGTKEIPADVYWGVHTARAVENFKITGVTIGHNPYLVRGLAYVKEAAARANHELGLLDKERMEAIAEACREIRAGALHEATKKAIMPVFTPMTMSISASPPTTPIQRR